MNFYYFTFGTEGQPYFGGWVVVIANDRSEACRIFRAAFPDKIEGLLNCSSVYTEEEFKRTEMAMGGNFGAFCHETICLLRA